MKKLTWKNGLCILLAIFILPFSLVATRFGVAAEQNDAETEYESIGLPSQLMNVFNWEFKNWWDSGNPWNGYYGEPTGRAMGNDGSIRFGGRKAFVSPNVSGQLQNKMITFLMNKQFSGEVHIGLALANWSSLWIGYDPGFDFVISDTNVKFVMITTTGSKQYKVAEAQIPEGLYVPGAYNKIEMGVFGELTGDRTMVLKINGAMVLEHTIPANEVHDSALNCIQIMQDTSSEDFLYLKNADEFKDYVSTSMGVALGQSWSTANWWNGGNVDGGMSLDAMGLHMWNQKAFNSHQNPEFSNKMITFRMQYDSRQATDPSVNIALAADPAGSAPWSGNDAFWFTINPNTNILTFHVRSNGTTYTLPKAFIPAGLYKQEDYNKVELGVFGDADGDRTMVFRLNGVQVHMAVIPANIAPDISTTSMRFMQDGYTNDIWVKEVAADITSPEISSFGNDLGVEWEKINWWDETSSNIGEQWVSDDGIAHRFYGQKGFLSPANSAYNNSLLSFLMEADLDTKDTYLVFGMLGEEGASRLHPSYEFIFSKNRIRLVTQPGWKEIASVALDDTAYVLGARNKIEMGVFGSVGGNRTMVLRINGVDAVSQVINAAFAPDIEVKYVYIQQDIGANPLTIRNLPAKDGFGEIPEGDTPVERLKNAIRDYQYKDYTTAQDLKEYFEFAVNDPSYTVEITEFNKIESVEGAKDSTGILVPGYNGYVTAVVKLTSGDGSAVSIGVAGRIAPSYEYYQFASVSKESDFQISKDGKTLEMYTGEAEKLVIPEGIEYIDDLWMYGIAENVRALILPESLKQLPAGIAWGMGKSLEVVYMGNRITVPKGNDFAGSFALKHIHLSENLTYISDAMFDSTVSLASVHIPATVKKIGASAFNRSLVRRVTIPASVEIIGANAFSWPCDNPYVFTSSSLNNALTMEQAGKFYPYVQKKLYDENGYIPREITVLNHNVEYTGPAYYVDDTGAWGSITVRAKADSVTQQECDNIAKLGYAITFASLDMTASEVALYALQAADNVLISNESTADSVLGDIKSNYLTSLETNIEWSQDFALTPSTAGTRGSATGELTLEADGVEFIITLERTFSERYYPQTDDEDDEDDGEDDIETPGSQPGKDTDGGKGAKTGVAANTLPVVGLVAGAALAVATVKKKRDLNIVR